MLQISYLKAMFTKESNYRIELAHQKQYLLLLLSRWQNRFVVYCPICIHVIDFTVSSGLPILTVLARHETVSTSPSHPRRKRTLKSLVHSIMFLNRTKKAAASWARVNDDREQIVLALTDVRNRRAAAAGKGDHHALIVPLTNAS
jgi:hypothetical protein